MPSTATSCSLRQTHLCEAGRSDEKQLARVGDGSEKQSASADAELRTEYPWTPSTHREKGEAVHQGTRQELGTPGQRGDSEIAADLGSRGPLRGQPGWNRHSKEPERQSLRSVQGGEAEMTMIYERGKMAGDCRHGCGA